ncbi:GNAT family N-acetyltransferase [Nocardioides marmoribigeumensis]|uniref:GNAT superfamily N-acetyltransferase n=1 Tax=Nocardioides marmoribigeumensis TaxID=433649 RepID=A0ABU2BR11_9ACTN|nr:GNAT family N-acetyltransferase [Nocardioides marmoribigeumensis]MDR7361065.1 GNAT superfamily N-acetyltransferase [Nocardioides marmoribigeumensis]
MDDLRDEMLRAYDRDLRGDAEVVGAVKVTPLGPVVLAEFDDGGGGFVSYRSLGDLDGEALDELVAEVVAFFRDRTAMERFEWKTRGHDLPADLVDHLVAAGLEAEEEETVMIGEAASLVVDLDLPDGVVVRRLEAGASDVEIELAALLEMQAGVFGESWGSVRSGLEGMARGDEYWVVEHEGRIVSGGRLVGVEGTEFAGVWGGSTVPEWRGRGLYRALVSARARSALGRGFRYIQSDCTPMSRPILERSGLLAVTTTTPYIWTR